ncbi:TlpA family protein disulfide reductase [Lysobacter sp. K5869]|uniref:TlpA family protein disulfide reductase n=1 Tax=Lysobacter sp. K5869 TaxID=2820808 RepID=UPI001C05FC4D|nr:TlpA disulfide reductase family protein [Lysobacter sp. K5869]QWP74880.1 TlpA family protein disulfide reductase [Lysobacter sp. K5869]
MGRALVAGLMLAFAGAPAWAQAPTAATSVRAVSATPATTARPASAAPALGEPAPDFLGLDRRGQPVKVSDYRGTPVVISFWAGWCAPCRRELPMLSTLQRSVGREHLQVIAVNLNEPKRDYEDFLRLNPSLDLNFVRDPGSAARYYGVRTVPNLFVVDRDGTLVQAHRGYSPEKIEQFVRELAPLLPPQAARKAAP